jgi:PAS domain S-box-containing protein
MTSISIHPPAEKTWLYLCLFALFLGLAVYLWRFRKTPGVTSYILSLFALSLWIGSRLLYGAATDIPAKYFWANVGIELQFLILAGWFESVLAFSQQKRKFPQSLRWGFWAATVLMTLSLLVDERLRWFWSSFAMQGQVMILYSGPANKLSIFLVYLQYLLCLGVCLRWILSVQGLLRKQAIALTIPSLFTVLGVVLGRIPALHPYAPLPVGVTLTAVLTTWAILRWRTYSLLPLAHDAVARAMVDALLVVDDEGYIVEMNPTARELFGGTKSAIGERIQKLGADWPALTQPSASAGDWPRETVQSVKGVARFFQIDVLPLQTMGGLLLGSVYILEDITQRKRDQEHMLAQQKALSALAERDLLARELHDTRGQFPGYVKTQAQALKRRLEKGQSAEVAEQLEQLILAAEAAFQDARETITSLKNMDKAWDFFQKLSEWLAQFRAMSGVVVERVGLAHQPERWIELEAEAHLFRILQEATTNARKHAQASRIVLTLDIEDEWLIASVEDDGKGFSQIENANEAPSYGLRIIRERAAEAGARCEITSAPEAGTRVTVRVPLKTTWLEKEGA